MCVGRAIVRASVRSCVGARVHESECFRLEHAEKKGSGDRGPVAGQVGLLRDDCKNSLTLPLCLFVCVHVCCWCCVCLCVGVRLSSRMPERVVHAHAHAQTHTVSRAHARAGDPLQPHLGRGPNARILPRKQKRSVDKCCLQHRGSYSQMYRPRERTANDFTIK